MVRLNRFAALVEVGGREVMVLVANSGRMRELLVSGHRVLLKPVSGDHRKTRLDLALVDLGFTLASADARLPNALVAEALEQGALPQFRRYPRLRREVAFAGSRLDLMLEGPGGRCYIETKSVTLVVDGGGLFPDAPTVRALNTWPAWAKLSPPDAGRRLSSSFSGRMLGTWPPTMRRTPSSALPYAARWLQGWMPTPIAAG